MERLHKGRRIYIFHRLPGVLLTTIPFPVNKTPEPATVTFRVQDFVAHVFLVALYHWRRWLDPVRKRVFWVGFQK